MLDAKLQEKKLLVRLITRVVLLVVLVVFGGIAISHYFNMKRTEMLISSDKKVVILVDDTLVEYVRAMHAGNDTKKKEATEKIGHENAAKVAAANALVSGTVQAQPISGTIQIQPASGTVQLSAGQIMPIFGPVDIRPVSGTK